MRIFILEDDPSRMKKFRPRLIGHEIVHTETSKEAIDILQREEVFDECFLDHDLGGKVFVNSGENTGYEVAEWISQHPEKRPKNIIVHSLNGVGAQNIIRVLGNDVKHIPFLWEKIVNNKIV